MFDRRFLYILLVVSLLIQVVMMRSFRWFPDLVLAVVVYSGIFYGYRASFEVGLAAGLLRGIFSAGIFPADIFIFPLIGLISAVLARMFYRQNPFVQLAITAVAVFTAVLYQTVYMNFIYGTELMAADMFFRSWPTVVTTVCLSPLMFGLLQKSGTHK